MRTHEPRPNIQNAKHMKFFIHFFSRKTKNLKSIRNESIGKAPVLEEFRVQWENILLLNNNQINRKVR